MLVAGVAVYRGPFGVAQAERLLWRAGFGPRVAQAGETIDRQLRLAPGTYRLSCTVADHAARGMVATLRVR